MTPNLTAFTGVDSQNLRDVMVSVQFILAIGDTFSFTVTFSIFYSKNKQAKTSPKISKQKPAGEKAPRVFVLDFNG
ncbi:hypothetical protein SB57_05365 [Lactobacillus delbrueckii subsp. bulgaricus]|nr:hypothetical protein SB57_05365 [Lactobacillus delbrueckii subsp. bulgaricus]